MVAAAVSVHAQTPSGTGGGTAGAGATTGSGTTVRGTAQINGQANGQQQNTPRSINSGNTSPGRAFNATNLPPGRPFRNFATNQNFFNTNQFGGATNQFGQTNPMAFNTNALGGTGNTNSGAFETNSSTFNASITNTLAAMSPEQAHNVIQFQTDLNALQQIAINLGGVQNVTQIIQQNPQVQAQLQQIQAQISNLAQGQVKPSSDTVQRLATDLLRSSAQAQLNPNQQLVIAIVINEMANSGTMDPTQIQNAINTAMSNIEGAGVPRSVSHTVSCDLHSMAFELQPTLQLQ